jgi:hypothetical protein
LLEGGERREDLEYPDDEWMYFQMADRFGWTPDQVDNLPASTADYLLAIAATVEQVKADRLNNG